MSSEGQEGKLKRSLSLFDVIALGVNAVIGQGIFLSPGLAAGKLGPACIVALLCAAGLAFLIALCFAEVGSRFKTTGGAYTYARETFGPFVGFEVGWMLCCVGVISWAALASGFGLVLGEFFPIFKSGPAHDLLAVGLLAFLAFVNIKGAKFGGGLSTFFSVAKLGPLLLFVFVGLFYLKPEGFQPFAPQGYDNLATGILILLYSLVGFESSVVPAGEMENPQKAIPIALVSVMTLVCIVYTLVFVVCIGTYPGLPGSESPVSEAAGVFMGSAGGTLVAAGIVISVFGINAASALVGPRKVFALAERGDLPKFLAYVSPETGVPRNAILVTCAASAVLAVSGKFEDLLLMGVVARFAQYLPTALAVIVLRRRDKEGEGPGFRVPMGEVVAAATVVLICWLIFETPNEKRIAGLIALGLGLPFYYVAQRKRSQNEQPPPEPVA